MDKLRLFCLLAFSIALLLPGFTANALTLEQETRFTNELWAIIDRQPKYVWGGSESEDKGLDCSGYLYLAGRRSCSNEKDDPFSKLRRTTAYRMSLGYAGWDGIDVKLRDTRQCDVCFWTWRDRPQRKCGHTGALIRDRKGSPKVTHASQLRGRIVIEDLKGKLLTDLDVIRRLKGQ